MRIFRNKILICGMLAAVFLGSVQVTAAFLSKNTNVLNNVITTGNIEIELREPGWADNSGLDLVPQESVRKDPCVENTGKNDAWIFLKVNIPVRSVSLVDPDTKKKLPREKTELFSFQVSDEWMLIDQKRTEDSAEYIYAWKKLLSPGEKTAPLFDQVSLVNILEGELNEQEKLEIPVTAMAIQENAGTDPQILYTEYLKQKAADEKKGES